MSIARIVGCFLVLSLVVAISGDRVHTQQAPPFQFHLLEATIADVHRGIQLGQVSCRALVQAYINQGQGVQRDVQSARHRGDGADVSARLR